MKDIILSQLAAIEKRENVRILYACESGSRAWGFVSPDSDYDVRFIYAQPKNYLSIRERKDVIELPVDAILDINGWDIRKALQLFLKSNAPLYEWLQSPIVYKEESGFAADLRDLMPGHFSPRAGCHHYISMAYKTFHDLQGDQVRLKKYFYALRPALACAWIIEKQGVPPMEFGVLRALITDPGWNQAIDELLEQKVRHDEKAMIQPVPLLQEWIATTLAHYKEKANAIPALKLDTDELDQLFREIYRLTMTFEQLTRQPQHLLLKCVSGSRAYNLALPTSDTDIKGIFVLPRSEFYGLTYTPQVSNDTNDEVFFEIGRFIDLLTRNNPNILELLSTPEKLYPSIATR